MTTPYIGAPIRRKEDRRFLTGRGQFVDDFKLPNVLHAAIVRSPHAHAHILSIDTGAAREMPGVVDVLTFDDIAAMVEPRPISGAAAGVQRSAAVPAIPAGPWKGALRGRPGGGGSGRQPLPGRGCGGGCSGRLRAFGCPGGRQGVVERGDADSRGARHQRSLRVLLVHWRPGWRVPQRRLCAKGGVSLPPPHRQPDGDAGPGGGRTIRDGSSLRSGARPRFLTTTAGCCRRCCKCRNIAFISWSWTWAGALECVVSSTRRTSWSPSPQSRRVAP